MGIRNFRFPTISLGNCSMFSKPLFPTLCADNRTCFLSLKLENLTTIGLVLFLLNLPKRWARSIFSKIPVIFNSVSKKSLTKPAQFSLPRFPCTLLTQRKQIVHHTWRLEICNLTLQLFINQFKFSLLSLFLLHYLLNEFGIFLFPLSCSPCNQCVSLNDRPLTVNYQFDYNNS